ncbi:MAG: hypothetical protein JWO99_821 [Candidatus Saccharibacteria bacterium]|nr:hypothetical protein [Candidatus Saccharibacteria bacterium]
MPTPTQVHLASHSATTSTTTHPCYTNSIVEFKKPNRYSNGRTRLSVPERDNTAPVTPAPQPITPKTQPKRRVNIRDRFFPLTKKTIILAIVVVVIIGGGITATALHRNNVAKKAASDASNIITNPGYQTILPNDKTITQLGGWQRISPPNSDPVFAYSDKIDGIAISVSEQPLPISFGGDVDAQVAELAKKFNATNKVTAGDTTVYLGTSAKGPQSAIFIKINLLILIKSQDKINDDAWIKYVKSLNITNKVPVQPGNSVSY